MLQKRPMTDTRMNPPALRAMLAACLFYASFGGLIQWFPRWLREEALFTGEQVGEGKKSLAYAVVFRSPSKTLSAEDSDAIRKAIVAEAAEIGAQLRA